MDRVFAHRFAGTLLLTSALACFDCDRTVAQSSFQPAPAPTQTDATYTPDPYYTQTAPALNAPQDANAALESWLPPAPTVATPPPATNQVRSLMESENEAWAPPLTPVADGYNPAEMTHSPIPYTQPQATPAPRANDFAGFGSPATPNNVAPAPQATPHAPIQNQFVTPAASAAAPPLLNQMLIPAIEVPRFSKQAAATKPIAKPTKKLATLTPNASASKSTTAASNDFAVSTANVEPKAPPLKPSKKLAFDPPAKPKRLAVAKKAEPAKGLSSPGSSKKPTAASSKSIATKPKSTPKTITKIRAAAKPANSETFVPTQLLALVGNEPVFVADTLLEVNQLIEQKMAGAPESVKDEARASLIKRILPKFIDQKILYVGALQSLPEEADIEKIVEQASKEFDEKALPEMMEQAKVETAADFDRLLRSMGSSLRKRRDGWARDQLTRYFLSQQLNVNEEVTHQQLLKEYREGEEHYRITAKTKWEQIMVRFDRFDSKAEARAAIEEMLNNLIRGANLSALARKSSHGFRASSGGQHDWTSKDALVLKEIDKAIFELPIGTLSDVIETRDGLHIVRVTDRQDAGLTPFTEAQGKIKERLKLQRREAAFDEHLAKLREKIPVEYFAFEAEAPNARTAQSTDLTR